MFYRRPRFGPASLAAGGILLVALAVGLLFLPAAPAAGTAAAPTGYTKGALAPRIVGGSEVDPPGKYPFVAAIAWRGVDSYHGQFCGGSVISPDWVLTAAHCVVGESADTLDVVIGRHHLASEQGQRIQVDGIVVHPDYSKTTAANDLALIHLATPTFHTPVQLPADPSLEQPGTMLTVAGWGSTRYPVTRYPYELREASVPVVDDAQCLIAYLGSFDGPTEVDLCAGDLAAGGVDSCQGDSGGPLFAATADGYVQVGIVSRGEGCALPGYPGIYTRVSAFIAWMTETIGVIPGPPGTGPRCFGRPATIEGTAAGETIYGTAGDDVILGRGGDDVIYGLGGNDRICGNLGDDDIRPGPGDDRAQGGPGSDVLLGAPGNDLLKGGAGDDRIHGNAGDDRLVGQRGDDALSGDDGDDVVNGGPGTDRCEGEMTRYCQP